MIVKYGPRKKRSAEERFWDKVNREGENRRCVNPDHLEPVTRRENILRGQSLMAHNARKTHRALQLARQVRDS